MKKEAFLYFTEDCHLCELASAEIEHCPIASTYVIEKVDVAFDDKLFKRYGTQIPVLFCAGQALCWPFDEKAITVFFENIQRTA
ncbi:MAG: glutaredoxin family protein [Pseudomonadales bacterium]|nr:glutaredoxin family protein [Pseudomonadales bacterium]